MARLAHAGHHDAPAGTDATLTALEDQIYTFLTDDFGFTDPFDIPANSFASVIITTLPAAGSLALNGDPVTLGQEINAADIQANELTFLAASDANGDDYASFTFQVRDDGGTANSGVDLDASPNTLSLTVTTVNRAPTLTTTNTPGVYRATAKIEMAGEWQAQVAYEGPAGSGKGSFPVTAQR